MDQKIEVNQKLQEWACSLSGCDNTHVEAKTWLCGIEWGWSGEGIEEYYKTGLRAEINKGAYKPPDELYVWKDHINYRYGISFAKLYTAIEGGKVEDYKKSVASLPGKEIFKMNLYPIAFRSTDDKRWHDHKMDDITGFSNKTSFKKWCVSNRFPAFSKLRQKHRPKLIIGTGVTYRQNFLKFFGGDKNINKLNSDTITPISEANKPDRTYYWLQLDDRTLLVVVPFLGGRYGLNSDYLLQEMGDRIRKLLGKSDD